MVSVGGALGDQIADGNMKNKGCVNEVADRNVTALRSALSHHTQSFGSICHMLPDFVVSWVEFTSGRRDEQVASTHGYPGSHSPLGNED